MFMGRLYREKWPSLSYVSSDWRQRLSLYVHFYVVSRFMQLGKTSETYSKLITKPIFNLIITAEVCMIIIDKIYLFKFIQSALEVNLNKEKVKILRNYLHLYPMVYNMCEMVTQNMLRMLMENKFFFEKLLSI